LLARSAIKQKLGQYAQYAANHAPWLGCVVCALLSAGLYLRALNFGFWYDDVIPQFQLVMSSTFGQLALPPVNWDHYRPVSFLFMKLLYTLDGGFKAPVFHSVPILLNAASAALLWLFAFRLTKSRGLAWLAALAFVAFPFSAHVAANVAVIAHTSLVFFSLLLLLAYFKAWASQRPADWLLAHLCLLLAVLSHENGVILPAALVALELAYFPRRTWREWLRHPIWQFLVIPLAYILIWWLAVPKWLGGRDVAQVLGNILPALQLLVYPLLLLLRLNEGQGWLLGLCVVATVGSSLLLTCRTKWFGLWLWGTAWFILAIGPSLVLLPTVYIQHSTYLAYFPAVGLLLSWAAVVMALWTKRYAWQGWRWLSAAVGILLVVLMLVVPLPSIKRSLDQDAHTTRIVQGMRDIARQTPTDRLLTFVNLPYYWVEADITGAARRSPFPWFRNANIVIPEYSSAGAVIWANDGPVRQADALSYAGYNPTWVTTGADTSATALRALLNVGEVYVLDLPTASFIHLNRAWADQSIQNRFIEPLRHPPEDPVPGELELAAPLGWYYGQALELVGVALEPSAVLPGGSVALSLFWRSGESPVGDPLITVRLRDRFGGLLVQRILHSVTGLPVTRWEAGRVYVSRLTLDIPSNAGLGPTTLLVSSQLDPSAAPFSVRDASGKTLGSEPVVAKLLLGQASAEQGTQVLPANPRDDLFSGEVRLLGFDLKSTTIRAGSPLTVTLYWLAEKAIADNLTVFVHLVGADGKPVAQHDSEPNNGLYPTSSWEPLKVVEDTHVLPIPADLPPGTYHLVLGIYRWPSLERLKVETAGQATGDHVQLEQPLIKVQ